MNNINSLPPFKRFCVTIGNLPSSYVDSMSYYECLMWLCKYLKDTVIPAVNENATAVNELINWFNNLDVQDEIDNKLDEMAEDGTLLEMVKPYFDTYIQPQINTLNTNFTNFTNSVTANVDDINDTIDDFERRLSSVASGSPLKATSVSEMTDTTKIYVNTTDGKWYYYDGDSWEIGGTYQSTQIEDNSVTYNSLDTTLQKNLGDVTDTTEYLPIDEYYIDESGHIVSNTSGFYYYTLDVNPFDVYILDITFESYRYGNNTPLYCFMNGSTFISKLSKSDAVSEEILADNHFHVQIEVPYNANKILINTSGNLRNYILKVDSYKAKNIHKDQLDSQLQSIFTDEYESVSPTLFVDGAYIESLSTIQKVAGYSIYYYDVNPGEKYKISVKQFYNNPFLIYTSDNGQIIESIGTGSYTFKKFITQEKNTSSSTVDITDFVFTVPDYCTKIYINKMNSSDLLSLKKSTSYSIKPEDININAIKNALNPLNEKTLLFTGDSICAATTAGVKGYVTLISENNSTATLYNYGVDGATIAVDSSNPTKNVVSYIQTMHTEHASADYIIIQGGVNDFYKEIPLGTFNEHANFNSETTYDTSTFSGALEWIFNYCLNNFGGKKVGFIVTQKTYSGPNFYQYMDRAKAICKKWSIPYIDLYEDSDLNFAVTYQKANYSITTVDPTGDGLHPNLAGYQIIAPKIENWLKYKI